MTGTESSGGLGLTIAIDYRLETIVNKQEQTTQKRTRVIGAILINNVISLSESPASASN